ncbi:MAG: hypothetical protein ACP5UG_07080, partial [Thermoplasmata archaeon]
DNYYNSGNLNVYGDDGFLFDNFKVLETGPLSPAQDTINNKSSGDTWEIINGQQLGLSNTWYGYYNLLSPSTIDNLVSIPINLANAISVNMNFLTLYQIWARFSYVAYTNDVPNGFRLYIGIPQNNGITWYKIDTRWAGEAGYSNPWNPSNINLTLASTIPSAYYPGEGAFTGVTGPYIDLSQFVGQTIYIKFEVNGDYPTSGLTGYTGTFGYVTGPANNQFVFITHVVVQGYSLYSPIQVQTVWT